MNNYAKQKEKIRIEIMRLEKINKYLFPIDTPEKKIQFKKTKEEIRLLGGQWGVLNKKHLQEINRTIYFS